MGERLATAGDAESESQSEELRLRQFVHDLRHPVAILGALLDDPALVTNGGGVELGAHVGRAKDQLAAIDDMMSSVLRTSSSSLRHDLGSVVADVCGLFAARFEGQLIDDCDLVLIDAPQRPAWWRVLANLVDNACRAAGSSGAVLVTLRQRVDHFVLSVDDTGPGFGEISHGDGLGLHYVISEVTGLGGTVGFGAGEHGGCRVEISVPTDPAP